MIKEYIRESMSPYAISILLVSKKDETLRICVNCYVINKITIKYRHLIRRLDDMLDKLHVFYIFFKINLKSGYHKKKMKEKDEWKTSFKTKYDSYKLLVMPFKLTNTPSFMRLKNHILQNFIGKHVVVHFDDILIYSKNLKEHANI